MHELDEDTRTEYWACLALKHIPGLGARSCKRLALLYGSAFGAVQKSRDWADAGVRRDKAEALIAGVWRKTAKAEWDSVKKADINLVLWTDSGYPARLRELPDPPLFLYCRGDTALLSAPCVGIVGKRSCSAAGRRAAATISAELADAGITVVSGMAIGIDKAAHQAAVERKGSTIAVLGAGLDIDYPHGNRDLRKKIETHGLIITEYAPEVPPAGEHFPIRNRLISGLSLGVIVVEADLRSGSLVTAHLALEQNRSVYVLPQFIPQKPGMQYDPNNPIPTESNFSEGCQNLLDQGAQGVRNAEEILADLAPQLHDFVNIRINLQTPDSDIILQERDIQEPATPAVGLQKESPSQKQSSPPDASTVSVFADAVPDSPSESAEEAVTNTQSSVLPADSADTDGKSATSTASGFAPDSTEGRILALLQQHAEGMGSDALCQNLALSAADVSSCLVLLEMQDFIQRMSDLRYRTKI